MRSKTPGFTLLELLIALSLFSIVMVVVSSVFGTGILAWKRGEGESGFYQELRLTLERMGVELRNAVPYEDIPFEGKENLLSFVKVRSSRFSPSTSGWVQVTYEVHPTKDKISNGVDSTTGSLVLVRRESPLLKGEEREDVIHLPFSELRFSYPFFEEEGEWVWKASWDPGLSKRPPPFLKMELSLNEGERWEKLFLIPTGTRAKETTLPPGQE